MSPPQRKKNALPKKASPDIVYQEMYNEMRRYRDYELTVSTWYTTILLAIFGAVLTARFSESGVFQSVFSRKLIFIVATVIWGSGIFSVRYVGSRYSMLRKRVTKLLEPKWNKNPLDRPKITPGRLIYVGLSILYVALAVTLFIF